MRPIVIVGDGASGVLTAAALARHDAGPVLVVGSGDRPGAGLAYRTDEPYHLLNSRAGEMSLWGDRPDDFVAWCRRTGRPVAATGFASRRRYGGYLAESMARIADGGATVVRAGRAVAVDPAGPTVLLADGTAVAARDVVLAVGHDTPVTPPVVGLDALDPRRYVTDPWCDNGIGRAASDDRVLLVGTGLTAVDVALAVHRHRPDARVIVVSRHGLLPATHLPEPPPPVEPVPAATGTRELLRLARTMVAGGADWRAVVDGFRASADRLWTGMPVAERRRFLDHVNRYWQIHRHRMAPPVARAVASMRESGALRVLAGRPVRVVARDSRVEVDVCTDRGVRTLHCGVIVNCTGPGRWAAGRDPLAVSLRSAGLTRLDTLGYGLACDGLGRPVDATGQPVGWLWTLGPSRLGTSWETTAVPEIRAQADALAAALSGADRRRPVA